MSEVLDKCPNCQSYNVQTKVVHNPDTCDMNAEATGTKKREPPPAPPAYLLGRTLEEFNAGIHARKAAIAAPHALDPLAFTEAISKHVQSTLAAP